MKKIKKLLAMIMAMTMVLGMAMTVSAATVSDITSDITVIGLSQGVPTSLKMYQFASLNYDKTTNSYTWNIEEWAREYVTLNEDGTEYVIEKADEQSLKNAALGSGPAYDGEKIVDGTTFTYENVPIGGYIIVAADSAADYTPLVVTNTYIRNDSPDENGKPVAADVEVFAKSEHHTITKEQTDDFAQIGQTVSYTIHATFPMSVKYENGEETNLNEFKIYDKPTGLLIDESSVEVMLGNDDDITTQVDVSVDSATGKLTVDFANLLNGKHDGKDITITYDAVVTDVTYNNNASASSNTTTYEPGEVEGSNGGIEITKKDAEDKSTLTGVTFKVYDLGVDGSWDPKNPGEPMKFVFDADLNAYRPALSTDETSTEKITDKDGLVTIKGLDEGNYHFEEVVAPDGYSINEEGLTVTIDPADEKINVKGEFLDTKLASLPSTGGIGTTIFTIGGCAIMIAAAALYFVNRRKSEEN